MHTYILYYVRSDSVRPHVPAIYYTVVEWVGSSNCITITHMWSALVYIKVQVYNIYIIYTCFDRPTKRGFVNIVFFVILSQKRVMECERYSQERMRIPIVSLSDTFRPKTNYNIESEIYKTLRNVMLGYILKLINRPNTTIFTDRYILRYKCFYVT